MVFFSQGSESPDSDPLLNKCMAGEISRASILITDLKANHFSGIEDVPRVKGHFQSPHDFNAQRVFFFQKVYFPHANTVLTGTGAFHRQGSSDQAVAERFGFL